MLPYEQKQVIILVRQKHFGTSGLWNLQNLPIDHGVGSSDHIQKSVIFIVIHYLFHLHFHLYFVYLEK